MVWPRENQAAVLDAGDAENAARLENSFDLDEAVEWAVERFQHRVAETGVEVIVRKVEPVDAADPKLAWPPCWQYPPAGAITIVLALVWIAAWLVREDPRPDPSPAQ